MILNGLYDIFKIIYDEGEREWLDEEKYKEALEDLCVRLESGEITEEEYEEAEESILEQLKTVRRYKKEHGYTD